MIVHSLQNYKNSNREFTPFINPLSPDLDQPDENENPYSKRIIEENNMNHNFSNLHTIHDIDADFEGYEKIFIPNNQTGYRIEKAIDQMILNPYKPKSNSTVQDLKNDLEKYFKQYDDKSIPVISKMPIFENVLSEKERFTITALAYSIKKGIIVYASSTEKGFSLHIYEIEKQKHLQYENMIEDEKDLENKKTSRIMLLAFDEKEEKIIIIDERCIHFRDSTTFAKLKHFLELKTEPDLNIENKDILTVMEYNIGNSLLFGLKDNTILVCHNYMNEDQFFRHKKKIFYGRQNTFVVNEERKIWVTLTKKLVDIRFFNLPNNTSPPKQKYLLKDAHFEQITAICLSKQNDNTQRLISGDQSNRIKIWDFNEISEIITSEDNKPKQKKEIKFLAEIKSQFVGEILSLDFNESPNNKLSIISTSSDKYIRIWKIIDNERWDEKQENPNEKYELKYEGILVGNYYQKEEMVEYVKHYKIKQELKGKTYPNKMITWGKKLLRIYDQDSIEKTTEDVRILNGKVTTLCLTPNGKKLISATEDKKITVWETNSLSVLCFGTAHKGSVTCLKVTSDNKYLLSGSTDKTIKIWDLNNKKLNNPDKISLMSFIASINADQGPITEILLTKDDKRIITSGNDIKFWDIIKEKEEKDKESKLIAINERFYIEGETVNEILALSMTSDGKKIISGGTKRQTKIQIWNIEDFERNITPTKIQQKENTNTTLTENFYKKKLLNSVSGGQIEPDEIFLYKFNGKPRILDKHTKAVYALSVSPDDKFLVSGSADRKIFLWDLVSNDFLVELDNQGEQIQEINALKYFPNGKFLLSGSGDSIIRVWDMKHKNLIGKMQGHNKAIKAFAISNDGETIYSASVDKSLRQWSLKTKREIKCLEGHSKKITSLILIDNFIYTSSKDHTIRVWDKNGEQMHILKGHKDKVISLLYAQRYKILISAGPDNIRFWNIDSKDEIINESKLERICAFDLSETNNTLITVTKDKKIVKWKYIKEKKIYKQDMIFRETPPDVVNIIKLINDESFITGDLEKNLIKWDIASGMISKLFPSKNKHTKKIDSILLTNKYLITCGGEINVWKNPSFEFVRTEKNFNMPRLLKIKETKKDLYQSKSKENKEIDDLRIYYSTDNNLIHSYKIDEKDENIPSIDLETYHINSEEENNKNKKTPSIYSNNLNPEIEINNYIVIDANFIVFVKEKKKLVFWKKTTEKTKGKKIRIVKNDTIKLHSDRITAMEMMPDGDIMITGSRDGTLILWRLREFKAICEEKKHEDVIFSIIALRNRHFISASCDNKLILWQIKNDYVTGDFTVNEVQTISNNDLSPKENDEFSCKNIAGLTTTYYADKIEFNQTQKKKREKYKRNKKFYEGSYMDINNYRKQQLKKQKIAAKRNLSKKKQSYENNLPQNENENLENEILIVAYKEKLIDLWKMNGLNSPKMMQITYVECNEDKLKEKKDPFSKRMKTVGIKNEPEIDTSYAVAVVAVKKRIILGYSNGKIYSLTNYENEKPTKDENENRKKFDMQKLNFNDFRIKLEADDYYKGHKGEILSLMTSPSDKYYTKLISSSLDKSIRFWNLENGNLLQTIYMNNNIDFQLTRPVFLIQERKDRLLLINNLIYDITNELVVFKGKTSQSKAINYQRLFCPKTRKSYHFDKLNGMFSKSSLIDNNLLFYMKEYSKIHNFFLYPEMRAKRILNGSSMLYPFYCNFLHLNAFFSNNEHFFFNNLEDIEGISLEAFTHKNSLGQSPISILLELANKPLLKTYFQLLFKSFKDPSTAFIQKIKFFQHNFKFYKDGNEIKYMITQSKCVSKILNCLKKKNSQKEIEENKEIYDEYNMYHYMIRLMEIDKHDLSIISEIFNHSLIDLELRLQSQELKHMEFMITRNENLAKSTITDQLEKKKKSSQGKLNSNRNATIKAKIFALPYITDSSKRCVKEFYQRLIFVAVTNPIFSNNVLKDITNYKWKKIYQNFYRLQLLRFLVVLASFITNFAYILPLKEQSIQPLTIIISTIIDVLLIFYFIFVLLFEIQKISLLGIDYFLSIWNIVDLLLCFLVNASTALDMSQLDLHLLSMTVPKIIYSYAMLLLWIRIVSYFRGFESTGFLLRLIFRVIFDIRFFLLFIVIFVLGFTYSAYLLQTDLVYHYNQFEVWQIFYRLILGDFNLFDEFALNNVEIFYFIWILLMMTTILTTIILLNLLISIIQATFTKVLESEDSMKIYERLSLIHDFELHADNNNFFARRKHSRTGKYLLSIYNETREPEKKISLESISASVEDMKSSIDKKLNTLIGNRVENKHVFQKKEETVSLDKIMNSIQEFKSIFNKERVGASNEENNNFFKSSSM